MDPHLQQRFLAFSVDKLAQFTSRIANCLAKLTYEQIWARGSENENAAGNLVLHLCGNVRQWVISGVAGKPDIRVRDREFQARGDIQAGELIERLEGVIAEASEVIRNLPPGEIADTITVQGYEITKLEAIYHVVEHFAQHTGQIIFVTKMATGSDLGFYGHLQSSEHGEATP